MAFSPHTADFGKRLCEAIGIESPATVRRVVIEVDVHAAVMVHIQRYMDVSAVDAVLETCEQSNLPRDTLFRRVEADAPLTVDEMGRVK